MKREKLIQASRERFSRMVFDIRNQLAIGRFSKDNIPFSFFFRQHGFGATRQEFILPLVVCEKNPDKSEIYKAYDVIRQHYRNMKVLRRTRTIEQHISDLRKCTKCGRILPIEQFYKNSSREDGLQCWCKDCHHEYESEIRKVHSCKSSIGEFTSIELYEELLRRGFVGTMTRVETLGES